MKNSIYLLPRGYIPTFPRLSVFALASPFSHRQMSQQAAQVAWWEL